MIGLELIAVAPLAAQAAYAAPQKKTPAGNNPVVESWVAQNLQSIVYKFDKRPELFLVVKGDLVNTAACLSADEIDSCYEDRTIDIECGAAFSPNGVIGPTSCDNGKGLQCSARFNPKITKTGIESLGEQYEVMLTKNGYSASFKVPKGAGVQEETNRLEVWNRAPDSLAETLRGMGIDVSPEEHPASYNIPGRLFAGVKDGWPTGRKSTATVKDLRLRRHQV